MTDLGNLMPKVLLPESRKRPIPNLNTDAVRELREKVDELEAQLAQARAELREELECEARSQEFRLDSQSTFRRKVTVRNCGTGCFQYLAKAASSSKLGRILSCDTPKDNEELDNHLDMHNLMDYRASLRDLGVSSRTDILYLSDKDLRDTGMSVVQMRRLQSNGCLPSDNSVKQLNGGGQPPSGSSSPGAQSPWKPSDLSPTKSDFFSPRRGEANAQPGCAAASASCDISAIRGHLHGGSKAFRASDFRRKSSRMSHTSSQVSQLSDPETLPDANEARRSYLDQDDDERDSCESPMNLTASIKRMSIDTTRPPVKIKSSSKRRASAFWQQQLKGRPRRMIFIRHGESEANVDRKITQTVPDHVLHLTAKGREQALDAGVRLRDLIGQDSVKFVVSPYARARETLNGILHAWGEETVAVQEDVRMREQEFGNFDSTNMRELQAEKKNFGVFYYRFPNGESPADCYDRASSFLESMYRSWQDNEAENQVVVGHGLMILVTLMRIFKFPVDSFESFADLKNCEFVVLERPVDDAKFRIAFTWQSGNERQYDGLRTKPPISPSLQAWNGDPDAEMLNSVPRRSTV